MGMYIDDNSIRNLLERSNITIATHAHTGLCCPISLGPIELGDSIVILECSHIFLEANISEWLAGNHTCPMCRHDLRPPRPIIHNNLNNHNINNNINLDNDDSDYIDLIIHNYHNNINYYNNLMNDHRRNNPANEYDNIIG